MLIQLDGIDGCGKTTLCNNLVDIIPNSIVIPMLGMGPIGKIVRNKYLDSNILPKEYYTIAVMAANMETIYEYILPAIKEGKNVIVDRSIGSYWAYQVALEEKNKLALELFNAITTSKYFLDIMPTMHIHCYVSDDVAQQRMLNRDKDIIDLIDKKARDHIRKGYDQFNDVAINIFKWPFVELNCNRNLEEVIWDLKSIIAEYKTALS